MKDEEILKKLLDLRADNLRQERELFKHIAILSSAVIGIFAFSGSQHLSSYSKIGILGLFLVIIISVLLLFFVLTMERVRAARAQEMIADVKKIKNETILKASLDLFNQKNINLVRNLIKGKGFDSFHKNIIPAAAKFWQDLSSGDSKINDKKKGLSSDKEKRKDLLYRFFSLIGIFLFIASLGLIIADVLRF